MRRSIDNVEIKEPPIKELKRRRSCLKYSCTTGCGCVIFLLVGALIFLQFAAQPRQKEVKAVPTTVQSTVPLYDEDAIERIAVMTGKERAKAANRLAVIPRLVATPIFFALERAETSSSTTSIIQTVRNYLSRPIGDGRDQIVIEWSPMVAKAQFIDTYYKTELRKKGFTISVVSESETLKQFSFADIARDIDGVIYIQDDLATSGTDYVLMTIDIPGSSE